MATRYGRRTEDGTYEYHDSKESLEAAKQEEAAGCIRQFFGLVGLVGGGFLSYQAVQKYGLDWPKWLRLTAVVVGAGSAALILGLLGRILAALIALAFSIGVLYSIGSWLWKVV